MGGVVWEVKIARNWFRNIFVIFFKITNMFEGAVCQLSLTAGCLSAVVTVGNRAPFKLCCNRRAGRHNSSQSTVRSCRRIHNSNVVTPQVSNGLERPICKEHAEKMSSLSSFVAAIFI